MGDLLGDYLRRQRATGAYDEVFAPDGSPRPAYGSVVSALESLSIGDLVSSRSALSSAFTDAGVTFSLSGEERPFPLDVVPRLFTTEEWQQIERGVSQRVRALEAFLDDVYGEGRAFADGVLPRRLITTSKHFHRAAHGICPDNGVRVHVAGIDLVRDQEGELRVLEDNLRIPSGVSYVLENRRTMARVLPNLFGGERVQRVSSYPARLRSALRASAPDGVADPTVVVLTPGAYNSAYFEHSLLARQMGIELVEGRDLVSRDGVVYLRTTDGEQRVDVVYRRIDDEFLDPLHFRPDSVIGCPGLLGAARAGNVTIANAVGNGVADDKLAYTYVPAMVEYYLGETPLLRNVETYRLEEPDAREYVLAHLDSLVVKPVDGSGGYGLVIGPAATERQLAKLRRDVIADPRRWIAQPVVPLSTAPTLVDGELVPRHLDLRPFAVNDGERIWVLPGGLTRVALVEGSLVVNSSQGGGSKDTWVLSGADVQPQPAAAPPVVAPGDPLHVGVPAAAPHLGQAQQQQQQSDDGVEFEGTEC
ncbi:MAG TPA: circularly permuted type 2 ATP-grasp protein [Mycobacteriales bacterium]|nr:circularly permuted type 2 ATP-grasp protein [Mycobacteriales bacterium]